MLRCSITPQILHVTTVYVVRRCHWGDSWTSSNMVDLNLFSKVTPPQKLLCNVTSHLLYTTSLYLAKMCLGGGRWTSPNMRDLDPIIKATIDTPKEFKIQETKHNTYCIQSLYIWCNVLCVDPCASSRMDDPDPFFKVTCL